MRLGFSTAIFVAVSARPFRLSRRLHSSGRTLVVIPFENTTSSPAVEWLGEALPRPALAARLSCPLRCHSRGTTPSLRSPGHSRGAAPVPRHHLPHRRTDGPRLCRAWLLPLRWRDPDRNRSTARHARPQTAPQRDGNARLSALGQLQSSLAWDLLRKIRTDFAVPKDKYIADAPAMPLDELDSYIHGMLATAPTRRHGLSQRDTCQSFIRASMPGTGQDLLRAAIL